MHWPNHSCLECENLHHDRRSLIKVEPPPHVGGEVLLNLKSSAQHPKPSLFSILNPKILEVISSQPSLHPQLWLSIGSVGNSWYRSQDCVTLNCFRFRVIDEVDEMWDFGN
ncbi:hypothetical protein CDAR_286891 [Caerostris darwini]|uniref:Uncharacterized protein n=1 Tax=Caerostris darwini TaxID=1538125 RepID=A0AAV4RAR0_9ARAC|nr:hypothetical protein CDAR_286891 [Caerostris darwini]